MIGATETEAVELELDFERPERLKIGQCVGLIAGISLAIWSSLYFVVIKILD